MTRRYQNGVAILAEIALRGLRVRTLASTLYVGPRTKVTPELEARIRRHKVEVIQVLTVSYAEAALRLISPMHGDARRFTLAQESLRRWGLSALADKPPVVHALLATMEEITAKLSEGGQG